MESGQLFRLRTLLRRCPNLAALLFGCAVVLLALAAAEGSLRLKAWLTRGAASDIETKLYTIVQTDPVLGARPIPGSRLTDTCARGGMHIYTAHYTIDAQGLRATPVQNAEQRTCLALFFGCSMTFGLGVNDDETLPARFGQSAPEFIPLNFAFPGYGPQHMWLLLHDDAFVARLDRPGLAFFVYIDNHMARLVGAPGVLQRWTTPLPWLCLEDAHIQHKGNFRDRNPFLYFVHRYAMHSHLVRFAVNQIPRPEAPSPRDLLLSPENLHLAAQVVIESAERLRAANPGLRFCFLIYPGAATGKHLVPELEANGIVCLDYSGLLDGTGLPMDAFCYRDLPGGELGHPKPRLRLLVAQRLVSAFNPGSLRLSTGSAS